jgi:hypothetical protein
LVRICRSHPQRPLHPGLHPGGGGQVGVGADPDHDQDQVGGAGEVGFASHHQTAVLVVDGLDGDVVDHLDAVAVQLLAEQLAELDVHRGHDGGCLLDQGDGQVSASEGLGHLQADVAAPNDHGGASVAG